ncbi:MAG TPA: DoxX family protein [Herpetosiphonaceae bacterium]|jgi:uncharacterized membrane protein|nr:DoxX family protein [Herpetosiphonaceae bacterium]
MQLLFLMAVLLVPGAILTLVERWLPHTTVPWTTKGRAGLSLFFAVTSSGHFLQTAAMADMLPPVVPFRIEIIYLTGVLELLGAVGVWLPRLDRLAGLGLLLMMVGLLPANIYAAFNHVPFGGHELGPVYLLVRVPFQLFLIWWIYQVTVAQHAATPAWRGAAVD